MGMQKMAEADLLVIGDTRTRKWGYRISEASGGNH